MTLPRPIMPKIGLRVFDLERLPYGISLCLELP